MDSLIPMIIYVLLQSIKNDRENDIAVLGDQSHYVLIVP